MKIGIDARKIRDFGIGTHIENLIRYIPEFDTENEYIIFHYPEDSDYVPQTSPTIRLVPDISPKYSIRELVVLPFKMWQQRLDLFHATHYTLPPLRPCKGIVTIHDVIHLRFRTIHERLMGNAFEIAGVMQGFFQKLCLQGECFFKTSGQFVGKIEKCLVRVGGCLGTFPNGAHRL